MDPQKSILLTFWVQSEQEAAAPGARFLRKGHNLASGPHSSSSRGWKWLPGQQVKGSQLDWCWALEEMIDDRTAGLWDVALN